MGAIAFNGDIYPNGSSTAKDSVFDNTGTDLESANAEDAIKEVDGKVEELNSNKVKVGYANGTTSSEGTFSTDISASDIFILSANHPGTDANIIVTTFTDKSNRWAFRLTDTAGESWAGSTRTIRYAYIEI